MALDATVGGAAANSYVTVAEADAYFATRLQSTAWTGAVNATKEAALISATRLLDSSVEFTGAAADEVQALAWPRTGMLNRNGYTILSSVIPAALKNVVCELALQLIGADRLAVNDIAEQGIIGIKAGPVELRFKEAIEARGGLPSELLALLVPSWVVVPEPANRAFFEVL